MLEELREDLLECIKHGVNEREVKEMLVIIDKLISNPPNQEALETKLDILLMNHMTDAYECYYEE